MRSRAARLVLAAVACAAVGAAWYLLFQFEQRITQRRSTLQAFDDRARDAQAVLIELLAAQQQYATPGQSVEAWSQKVTSLLEQTTAGLDALRGLSVSPSAQTPLAEALDAVKALGQVDELVQGYLASGETVMAADVLASEGGESSSVLSRQLSSALIAERREFETFERLARGEQVYVLEASSAVLLLIAVLLALARPQVVVAPRQPAEEPTSQEARGPITLGGLKSTVDAPMAAEPPKNLARGLDTLKVAAELCTEIGRVNTSQDLTGLLSRAADALDAKGLILWICDIPGTTDLRPAMAHGYPPDVLARMATVPRSGDNAVASAYRTGALQIVLARPGLSHGAIVAPLLAPSGCLGALTAEIRGGSETSDAVQALASLVAAQLASLVASSTAPVERPADGRIASA